MERRKIKISKKGDDGYKVISVRIREGTLETIDGISKQTNRSRNEVINILLENAAGDIEIEEYATDGSRFRIYGKGKTKPRLRAGALFLERY